MEKHVRYRDVLVARGSLVYELLHDKNPTAKLKASAVYDECERAFVKYWPKEMNHLLNYKVGDAK